MGRSPNDAKGARGANCVPEGPPAASGRRENASFSGRRSAQDSGAAGGVRHSEGKSLGGRGSAGEARVTALSTSRPPKGSAKSASQWTVRKAATGAPDASLEEETSGEGGVTSLSSGPAAASDNSVAHPSVSGDDFDEPHPHDQHARHNTHSIIVRGGRRREKNDEASHRRHKQLKSVKRDDFPTPVFSVRYRDPLIELSEDRLTATGYKGWSSVFVTHCAERGKWYYELTVKERNGKALKFLGHPADQQPLVQGHFRLGWACRYQRYDVPVGFNAFGFVIRDTDGSTVCNSKVYTYGNTSIGEGDVLGAYLSLEEPYWWLPDPRSDHKLYEFIQDGILCNPENPVESEINKGSWIEFSLNGRRLGKAFKNIWNGGYHPAVALYMGARVTVNLGPDFVHPPPADFLPACEMARPQIP